jgi:hypothetical protein
MKNTTNKKPANGRTHEGANPACEEKWVHVHAALCASGCEALRDQAVAHGLRAGLVGRYLVVQRLQLEVGGSHYVLHLAALDLADRGLGNFGPLSNLGLG